ncbi:MAG: sodium:solute symporter family transporter [Planctomycetota bacterium]|jgi:Na+/proline symporter
MTVSGLDWLVVIGYALVVLIIGYRVGRGRREDADEAYLAGRGVPTWAAALSLVATSLSAATFLGAPGEAYAGDLSYLILNLGTIIGGVLAALVVIPACHRAGGATLYHLIGQRCGDGGQRATAVAFLVGRLLASGARLFMVGLALSLALFGSVEMGPVLITIALCGVIGTAYTAFGGLRAVVWTDILQLAVFLAVVVLCVVAVSQRVEADWPTLWQAAADAGKLNILDLSLEPDRGYTLWTGLAMTLFIVAAYGTDQDLAQRLLGCGSPRSATRGLLSGVAIGLPVTLLFLILGVAFWALYQQPALAGAHGLPPPPPGRPVMAHFLLTALETPARGFAIAGLLAAAMSSFDSAGAAMSSSLACDLRVRLPPRLLTIVCGAALVVAALVLAVTYDPENDRLLPFALGVMTFAYGGLLGVFTCVLLLRRGNTASVIAALLSGALVIACCRYGPAWFDAEWKLAFAWWMVPATVVSCAVCALGRPPQVGNDDD